MGLNSASSFSGISLSETTLNFTSVLAGRALGLPCDDIWKFFDITRAVLFTSTCSAELEAVFRFNSACVRRDIEAASVVELVGSVPASVCIRF